MISLQKDSGNVKKELMNSFLFHSPKFLPPYKSIKIKSIRWNVCNHHFKYAFLKNLSTLHSRNMIKLFCFNICFHFSLFPFQGRCNREKPPCKYFHPPQHLKDQLLINGRNHLALKNALMQQMGISPGQPVLPGQVPAVVSSLPCLLCFGHRRPTSRVQQDIFMSLPPCPEQVLVNASVGNGNDALAFESQDIVCSMIFS